MFIYAHRKIFYVLQGIMRDMKRVVQFWKIILLDTLGLAFMVAAILTGWLPGPGGIPLFILGLSLLAVNHAWAKRYMNNFESFIQRLSRKVFSEDERIQDIYDIIFPVFVVGGAYLLWKHTAPWYISVGIFLFGTGTIMLLGNRGRWQRLKSRFKK